MKLGFLTISWFDILVLALLAVGILRGRKRGMSQELLDLCQWLAMVIVGALFYAFLGQHLARYTHVSLVFGNVAAYVALVVAVKLGFTFLKRCVGEKLLQSDAFGGMEYYLGMVSGCLRFACMVLVGLALLHARHTTAEELAAQAKMQRDNFGDISFPTLATIQQDVFQASVTGSFVRTHLKEQLIAPTPSRKSETRMGIGQRRQRAVEEVLGAKK
jgi:uncharacterized membrane protein required for colicin V production